MGGIEISLINILNNLDYSKYDVTVLALRNYQDLVYRIPKECRVIIADRNATISFPHSYKHRRLFGLMEEPQKTSYLRRLIWKVLCALLKAPEAILWSKYIRNEIANERFDTVVIYDNRTAETAVRALSADKYIMFYHQGIMSHAYHDIIGWKKANEIVAVSEPLAQRLRSFMPKYAHKIITINNLLETTTIRNKSQESVDLQFNRSKINIISCGRLSREKGMHIALDVCAKLKKSGFSNFSWYFIGGA